MNDNEIPWNLRADRGLFELPFKKILNEYQYHLLYGKPDFMRRMASDLARDANG